MNQIYPPNLFAPIIIVEPRNFVADTDTGDIIANTDTDNTALCLQNTISL